eukprot:Sspe_Gene.8601::Locus_2911_Transcript_1_1_Confidence_1.000_Length_1912::g.8601::m.8601
MRGADCLGLLRRKGTEALRVPLYTFEEEKRKGLVLTNLRQEAVEPAHTPPSSREASPAPSAPSSRAPVWRTPPLNRVASTPFPSRDAGEVKWDVNVVGGPLLVTLLGRHWAYLAVASALANNGPDDMHALRFVALLDDEDIA